MTFNTQRVSLLAESVVGAHYPNQLQSQWMKALHPSLKSLRSSYYTSDKVQVDYATKRLFTRILWGMLSLCLADIRDARI